MTAWDFTFSTVEMETRRIKKARTRRNKDRKRKIEDEPLPGPC